MVAVPLQGVERILHGLINSFFNLLPDLFDVVGASRGLGHHFRNVDSGHIEASLIQGGPSAGQLKKFKILITI